jgi:hypothetical protein
MTTRSLVAERLHNPHSQAALCNVRWLIGGYLGISVLTLVAIVLLHGNAAIAPIAVLVRGTIVVVHSLLMILFAAQTARGSKRGYIFLWLASAIMSVAIAVILAIPGDFPLWFKIEQGVCGLLLLGVVVVINGKHLRSAFAAR